jgi:hypothetical protein
MLVTWPCLSKPRSHRTPRSRPSRPCPLYQHPPPIPTAQRAQRTQPRDAATRRPWDHTIPIPCAPTGRKNSRPNKPQEHSPPLAATGLKNSAQGNAPLLWHSWRHIWSGPVSIPFPPFAPSFPNSRPGAGNTKQNTPPPAPPLHHSMSASPHNRPIPPSLPAADPQIPS